MRFLNSGRAIILILYWILYWLTVRISYVARKMRRLATSACQRSLLNPSLLLAVMKLQSTRPELVSYALLGPHALAAMAVLRVSKTAQPRTRHPAE
jgi:hypothetical protein